MRLLQLQGHDAVSSRGLVVELSGSDRLQQGTEAQIRQWGWAKGHTAAFARGHRGMLLIYSEHGGLCRGSFTGVCGMGGCSMVASLVYTAWEMRLWEDVSDEPPHAKLSGRRGGRGTAADPNSGHAWP